MPSADDIITIDNRAIRRLEREFRDLGDVVLGRALSNAMNDVALEANKKMALAFDRNIKGGPTAFTKINPGQRKSSVVEVPGRHQAGQSTVQSAIRVQPLQSTFLKYILGEKDVRLPGDVGLAENVILVPIEANLHGTQGIDLKQGNVPKGAVKKILMRVADHRELPDFDREDVETAIMQARKALMDAMQEEKDS